MNCCLVGDDMNPERSGERGAYEVSSIILFFVARELPLVQVLTSGS